MVTLMGVYGWASSLVPCLSKMERLDTRLCPGIVRMRKHPGYKVVRIA